MNHTIIAKDHIRTYGLRATQPRCSIVESLLQAGGPITAPELEKSLSSHKLDRVTIYRAMRDFERVGIVRRIDFRDGEVRYELIDRKSEHHHIICIQCGFFEGVNICDEHVEINNIVQKSKSFSEAIDHSFEIFAICSNCSKVL